MSSLNSVAKAFRALHQPGSPLQLANVYDAITAKAVAPLPNTHALGTASYSVAAAAGLEDPDLDLESNLRAAKAVATVATYFKKPLTVDFQDGYGENLRSGIARLIEIGAAGVNIEDANKETGQMYSIEEAATRIRHVMQVAFDKGVPDFVVNARADCLLHNGTIEDAVERGRAYLAAGAVCVFVLGGSKRGGISRAEVVKLTEAFEGRLNVSVKLEPGNLTVKDLADVGVARCSIGPSLQFVLAEATAKATKNYYLSA